MHAREAKPISGAINARPWCFPTAMNLARRLFWTLFLGCAACHDSKVDKAEADLLAVKAHVAALKTKHQELLVRTKQAELSRWALAQQADDAALASLQLSAAEGVLEGKPLAAAFELPAMVTSKDSKAVLEFAAHAVQDVVPCVKPGDPDYGGPGYSRGPNCDPPPVEDTCAGVAARNVISGKWSCETKVEGGPKLPALLACTLTAEYPPDAPAELNETKGMVISRTLVRAAFTHQGHLYVADYPAPSIDAYQPANQLPLEACKSENGKLECERSCEDSFHRLDRPNCGIGADGEGDTYDGPPPSEEPDEPAEVRSAREEAARAEGRAAAAQRDADAAKDELAYQECRSACRPDPVEDKARGATGHGSPIRVAGSTQGQGCIHRTGHSSHRLGSRRDRRCLSSRPRPADAGSAPP